jgi:hypothetical protein
VDELSIADVDADMGYASPSGSVSEENQIAGLEFGARDGFAHPKQFRCRMRCIDSVTAQQVVNEARTIKTARRR